MLAKLRVLRELWVIITLLFCLVWFSKMLNLYPGSGFQLLGIRIRMFLGLEDPGPLVRGTDPVQNPSLFS